jgi:DNA-binding XRE family transcriptional regulator
MKRTSRDKSFYGNSPRRVNPYIADALSRERAASDFKTQMELIGAKFRSLRMEQGHGLESVAKALGISKHRLTQIECGTYIHFGLPLFYALTEYYGISTTDVLSVIPDASFVDLKH